MYEIPKTNMLPEWAKRPVEQFAKLATEANSSSDRACAVVLMVAIEDLLRNALGQYLPKSKVPLNDLVAPGRLAYCVTLAEAIGLLNHEIAETIRGLNKVRNAFAHKVLDSPSFSDPVIRQAMSRIKEPLELKGFSGDKAIRDRYQRLCGTVVIFLVMLRGKVKPLGVVAPSFGDLAVVLPRGYEA